MNRFSDGRDMDNEGEGGKQMDQRLPTLIPGRKWFRFYKWENQKGEKVYMKVSLVLNMLMVWGVGEKFKQKYLQKNEKCGIRFRARDLIPWGFHIRKDIEWPLFESSK